MALISSDEVSYLVYRYLKENGYDHSAFTFAHESLLSKSGVADSRGSEVPPGALVAFLQKGLLYLAIEEEVAAHAQAESTAAAASPPAPGSSKNAAMPRRASAPPLSLVSPQSNAMMARDASLTHAEFQLKHDRRESERAAERGDAMDTEPDAAAAAAAAWQGGAAAAAAAAAALPGSGNGSGGGGHGSGDGGAKRAKTDEHMAPAPARGSESEDVLRLMGHTAEVFCCSWNPRRELLASGSGDASVRLWPVPDGRPLSELSNVPLGPVVLDYAPPPTADGAAADGEAKMSRDITTLEWSPDGALLATGCMDGCARVWNDAGELKHTLSRHSESIFSLRFDPTGAHLLTGSYDKTVAVWDVNSGSLVKRFESHSAQVLDVDWQDASTFASCSTDKTIAVYTLGNDAPIGRFGGTAQGHADEVNAIRWDHGSGGGLLASCSDDHTAKLWKTDRGCVQTLGEHSKEIYTVRWRPKGSTAGAGGSMLATASFDTTVRLWDAETATAVHTLRAHDKKVYTVAFSPDGKFLASGSLGGQLHIWNVADGALVRSFFCDSDIFEVAWNAAGTRVAATSTNAITVIDIRVV